MIISTKNVLQTALMVTLGSLMEQMNLKDAWRSASMERGAQCVMISGGDLMQWWLVDNWDLLQPVRDVQLASSPGPVPSYSLYARHDIINVYNKGSPPTKIIF